LIEEDSIIRKQRNLFSGSAIPNKNERDNKNLFQSHSLLSDIRFGEVILTYNFYFLERKWH